MGHGRRSGAGQMPVPPLTRLLSRPCLHVVVDMQRLFAEPTVWHTPALTDIVPRVVRLTRHAPEHTVFLRFIPPERPDHASGAWRTYYERWRSVTLAETGPALLELVDPLRAFAPPARICDKTTHSAFNSGDFRDVAGRSGAEVLVLSGVETDVCVLGTALDAIDEGFYVVLVSDAVASSVPESHRATLESLVPRFDEQAVVATTAEVLSAWQPRTGGDRDRH